MSTTADDFLDSLVPSEAASDRHLHFVLRVHDGITKTLASHIASLTAKSGKETCLLSVSAEGPYGSAPHATESASVLLVAGGSGITHVASVLGQIVEAAEAHSGSTKSVKLVWAIHHLSERTPLPLRGRLADSTFRLRPSSLARIDPRQLFVPRPDSPEGSSEQSTPTTSPRESSSDLSHEKGQPSSGDAPGTKNSIIHHGRPDIANILREVVANTAEHTFVLGTPRP